MSDSGNVLWTKPYLPTAENGITNVGTREYPVFFSTWNRNLIYAHHLNITGSKPEPEPEPKHELAYGDPKPEPVSKPRLCDAYPQPVDGARGRRRASNAKPPADAHSYSAPVVLKFKLPRPTRRMLHRHLLQAFKSNYAVRPS
eukprot:tig00000178_g12758.t1